jgi:hypothetical protein
VLQKHLIGRHYIGGTGGAFSVSRARRPAGPKTAIPVADVIPVTIVE